MPGGSTAGMASPAGLEQGDLSTTSPLLSAPKQYEHASSTPTDGYRTGYAPESPMAADAVESPPPAPLPEVPKLVEIRLYISHFLSTWNSRLFEFAAVLFLAAIYPNTLLPMSVYALVRSGSAIVFAQSIGSWIDRGERLTVVRTSIVGQRIAVVGSCGIFWAMVQMGEGMGGRAKAGAFAVTVVLACVEKSCAQMNLISIERDWVVVITEENEPARRALNARMRRIDLLCKLLGPLVISLVALSSTLIAIWVTLGMSGLSIVPEYLCIEKVYKGVPSLCRRKQDSILPSGDRIRSPIPGFKASISRILPISSLPFYFSHSALLPSFSLALLYLTVLSFSGQMITFLISVGYSPLHIGIARTLSTIFELSATWIAPYLMRRIGMIRGGMWSISWQMIWLAGGVTLFVTDSQATVTRPIVSATVLAITVGLSRIGLWGYDLCAQNIIQDEVESDYRGTFSTVEASFQNLFELLSYATTIVFSRPDQFHWPVLISCVAVYAAGGLYACFVRRRRGHLLHVPDCHGWQKHSASRSES
ncbi:related to iron transporter [Cephalotrichum gorgonifer]|uniref:Solute carrier family 40 member n=1 Tax=Cephalotrichum gorgonifer TaxID=2041049 RepID=A0AAE8MUN8_9PEZI|nr:related to iron transporter [Cephalotrichum gorgonifer]